MRPTAFLLLLAFATTVEATEPKPILLAKPTAFPTLVNPKCSHCVDEAKRRKDELTEADPVLWWTRGYSGGGAVPLRFFLNSYRVISDSYGVFVYDPDAGYARGFAASYNFEFHGWRNGVMVMRDKSDGTLFSCLSGVAFDGPRTGERLASVPTVRSTWGEVMVWNPNAVAYEMFEKYKPSELPTTTREESVRTQLTNVDPRLRADELVLGVRVGNKMRAYPLAHAHSGLSIEQELNGTKFVLFFRGTSSAAYQFVSKQPRKWKGPNPDKNGVSPPDAGVPLPNGSERPDREVEIRDSLTGFHTPGTGTNWGPDGRGKDGDLDGWTLEPVEGVVCKWFAWSAEYPDTEVSGEKKAEVIIAPAAADPNKAIAGRAEFLRLLPKPFGTVRAIDAKARTVSLLLDGEKTAKVWSLEPDAEVWIDGFWGRLDQFKPGDRAWAWLKLNRRKEPVGITLLADELSEQSLHDLPWTVTEKTSAMRATMQVSFDNKLVVSRNKVEKKFEWSDQGGLHGKLEAVYLHHEGGELKWLPPEALEVRRTAQKLLLRKHWRDAGLPGSVAFNHTFSGELDVVLDHEAMRWGRSLTAGDRVELLADQPIAAVVKSVSPWRERTQVRLVVGELQASEVKAGLRIGLKMPWPKKDIDDSPYPPDIDRKRTTDERIEWFLASIYCVCGIGNDTCTGHFYSLASCNPNGCGAPNATRDDLRALIEKGQSDKQIWDALLKARGPLMTRPHLKP